MSYLPSSAFQSGLGTHWGSAIQSYQPSGGDWYDSIKDIGKSTLDIYKQQQRAEGAAEAAMEIAKSGAGVVQRTRLPSWALPAGIGAAALVLILVMKKK